MEPAVCHFIVNPRSGSSSTARRLRDLCARLARGGRQSTVTHTRHAGHATALAAQVAGSAAAVVAVGGDGTAREVAVGLLGQAAPMGVLPGGTENLIAKQLGFDREGKALLAAIEHPRVATIDVGFANDMPFLVIAGVGFDAQVVARVAAGRRGHITHMTYFWPLWRTFWDHRFPALTIRADEDTIFEGQAMAFVGNMPRYSLDLRICSRADWTDGLLDLCVMPTRHQGQLLKHAARVAVRRHLDDGRILYLRARRICIEAAEPVPVECDGDCGPPLPVQFSVRYRALNILLPGGRRQTGAGPGMPG